MAIFWLEKWMKPFQKYITVEREILNHNFWAFVKRMHPRRIETINQCLNEIFIVFFQRDYIFHQVEIFSTGPEALPSWLKHSLSFRNVKLMFVQCTFATFTASHSEWLLLFQFFAALKLQKFHVAIFVAARYFHPLNKWFSPALAGILLSRFLFCSYPFHFPQALSLFFVADDLCTYVWNLTVVFFSFQLKTQFLFCLKLPNFFFYTDISPLFVWIEYTFQKSFPSKHFIVFK